MTFDIELSNPTGSDIVLAPCPTYEMGLKGSPENQRSYELNCAGAGGLIKANSTVAFEMRYAVPPDLRQDSPSFLTWHLRVADNPDNPGPFVSTIVGPSSIGTLAASSSSPDDLGASGRP